MRILGSMLQSKGLKYSVWATNICSVSTGFLREPSSKAGGLYVAKHLLQARERGSSGEVTRSLRAHSGKAIAAPPAG